MRKLAAMRGGCANAVLQFIFFGSTHVELGLVDHLDALGRDLQHASVALRGFLRAEDLLHGLNYYVDGEAVSKMKCGKVGSVHSSGF